jgi:hypothetical protein
MTDRSDEDEDWRMHCSSQVSHSLVSPQSHKLGDANSCSEDVNGGAEGDSSQRRSKSGVVEMRCWECAWTGNTVQHANQQLERATHDPPPVAWLRGYGLRYCAADGHTPWVHRGARGCRRCKLLSRSDAVQQGAAAEALDADAVVAVPRTARVVTQHSAARRDAPCRVGEWLRMDQALAAVEAAVRSSQKHAPRRYLPRGAYGRQIAAAAVLDVASAAAEGCVAAQALIPSLPRVILRRGSPIQTQIDDLMAGRAVTQCIAKPTFDPINAYCARLRGAVAEGDVRAINRLLADGPSSGHQSLADAQRVIAEKFPRKPDGEMGEDGCEEKWIEARRAACGGRRVDLTPRTLIRWARAKRDKAADLGGFSGRLIIELHAVDPAVTSALAKLWSMDPKEWTHADGAAATWRNLRGAFIPQPPKLPRPIATAPVARRAWGSTLVRSIHSAAAAYCEQRGQFGMSGGGAQVAYVLAARVISGLGGDVIVDDRSNSFHELHRSAVYHAADAFIHSLGGEQKETVGRGLVELMARTFAGGLHSALPRSTYHFGVEGLPPRRHDALCQGSSESSLLESITYARGGWRDIDGGGVRCEFHDDGFTAVLPGAPIDACRRPATTDGSKCAVGKDRAVGPRAAEIVAAGHSRVVARCVSIAGVPVGEARIGLTDWHTRYRLRLARVREIATIDRSLAVKAACLIGGPAGLANHLLRALPPEQVASGFWARVDDDWVELWCHLLDLPTDQRTPATRRLIADRVFLRAGGCGLGMRSAREYAVLRYAEGIESAVPSLAAILRRAGVEVDRDVWTALGVGAWHSEGDPWDAPALQRAASERAVTAKQAAEAVDAARHARIFSSRADQHGPRAAADCTIPNLLVVWASGAHDHSVPLSSQDATIALRRLFGLPLTGQATGIGPPRSCQRCGAAAYLSRGDADIPAGPRARVDEHGDHALACAVAGGGTQRRHNEIAAAIRECVDAAGWRASTRGGPVFNSHGGRPADVWVAAHPAHHVGQALDCTVVSTAGRPPGRAAAAAEDAKEKKYRAEVDRHPGLGFAPLGFDLLGGIGPAAWTQMESWARAISRVPTADRSYEEARLWVTSVIATAFVAAVSRQIRIFDVVQRRRPFDVARTRGR